MNRKTLVYLSLIALVTSFVPAAQAQTFSVVHSFTGGADGAGPSAGVTIRGSVLYGTTSSGGNSCGMGQRCGNVYQITQVGSNWLTTPVALLGAGGGFNPIARVVFGPDGHLYGTTTEGVGNGGVVFDLIPPLFICKTIACYWSENILHTFQGRPDGAYPGSGDLIWDQQGNIYGATREGGTADAGTVFQMTKSGNSWTETPIYSFQGGSSDGYMPWNGVVMDGNGNLFGTTQQDGANGYGNVFKLVYVPQVGWVEAILYSFTGGSDGGSPFSGLIVDGSGNLYGATSDDGSGGGGTVFELIPSGNAYTFKLLYSISGQQGKTCGPWATLTMDAAGNLYGTTRCDGANAVGNIFKLTSTGNVWTYSSLHDFTGGDDGAYPTGNITIDTDGTLYGTAGAGGSDGAGVVWMIKP